MNKVNQLDWLECVKSIPAELQSQSFFKRLAFRYCKENLMTSYVLTPKQLIQ